MVVTFFSRENPWGWSSFASKSPAPQNVDHVDISGVRDRNWISKMPADRSSTAGHARQKKKTMSCMSYAARK